MWKKSVSDWGHKYVFWYSQIKKVFPKVKKKDRMAKKVLFKIKMHALNSRKWKI